ncbi:hypothetical protein Tco_1273141 [Tanacetum coccineum]
MFLTPSAILKVPLLLLGCRLVGFRLLTPLLFPHNPGFGSSAVLSLTLFLSTIRVNIAAGFILLQDGTLLRARMELNTPDTQDDRVHYIKAIVIPAHRDCGAGLYVECGSVSDIK